MTFFLIASIVKILVVFTVLMVGVALLTLAERRSALAAGPARSDGSVRSMRPRGRLKTA